MQRIHQKPPDLKRPILKNTFFNIKSKAFSDSSSKMAPTKRQNYNIRLIKSGENNEVWTEDYQDKPNTHMHDKSEGHEHQYSDFSPAIRDNDKVEQEIEKKISLKRR